MKFNLKFIVFKSKVSTDVKSQNKHTFIGHKMNRFHSHSKLNKNRQIQVS